MKFYPLFTILVLKTLFWLGELISINNVIMIIMIYGLWHEILAILIPILHLVYLCLMLSGTGGNGQCPWSKKVRPQSTGNYKIYNLQALSSALALLGHHSQGLWVINSVDPCVLKSNYYLEMVSGNALKIAAPYLQKHSSGSVLVLRHLLANHTGCSHSKHSTVFLE